MNSTCAPLTGRQPGAPSTTPVSTWPLPIFARRGGAPWPNGPNPSSGVGVHVAAGAVGAEGPEAAKNAAATSTAAPIDAPLTPVPLPLSGIRRDARALQSG